MIEAIDEEGRIVSCDAVATIHRHNTNWLDFLQHAEVAAVLNGKFNHNCGDVGEMVDYHWCGRRKEFINVETLAIAGSFWISHEFGGMTNTSFFNGFLQPKFDEGQHNISDAAIEFFKNARPEGKEPCCPGYAYLIGRKDYPDFKKEEEE